MTLSRTLKSLPTLLLLAAALLLPASASAGERTRSRDSDRSTRVVHVDRGHGHAYGKRKNRHEHRRTHEHRHVHVERPRVVVLSRPRVVVEPHCDLPVLSHARYHDLRHELRDAWFESERMEILSRASRYGMTSEQVAGLVSMLVFDSNKVDALVMLYGSVVDPGHFHVALDTLTFSSSRHEVRRRIG